jgi:hypothetical protein
MAMIGLVLSGCIPLGNVLGKTPLSPRRTNLAACLPEGRTLADVVSAQVIPGTSMEVQTITVRQALRSLGARCQNQTLVDRTAQEIVFFQLENCWGNPPINYQEIIQQQVAAIAALEETYTVIQMTCNPSGIPIP